VCLSLPFVSPSVCLYVLSIFFFLYIHSSYLDPSSSSSVCFYYNFSSYDSFLFFPRICFFYCFLITHSCPSHAISSLFFRIHSFLFFLHLFSLHSFLSLVPRLTPPRRGVVVGKTCSIALKPSSTRILYRYSPISVFWSTVFFSQCSLPAISHAFGFVFRVIFSSFVILYGVFPLSNLSMYISLYRRIHT